MRVVAPRAKPTPARGAPAPPSSIFGRTSRFHADQGDYVPATACAEDVGPGSYTGPKTATALVKRSFNVTFGGGVGGGLR